jgi:hypothetical protein
MEKEEVLAQKEISRNFQSSKFKFHSANTISRRNIRM